jgi:hypothetical protein
MVSFSLTQMVGSSDRHATGLGLIPAFSVEGGGEETLKRAQKNFLYVPERSFMYRTLQFPVDF